MMAAIHSRNM